MEELTIEEALAMFDDANVPVRIGLYAKDDEDDRHASILCYMPRKECCFDVSIPLPDEESLERFKNEVIPHMQALWQTPIDNLQRVIDGDWDWNDAGFVHYYFANKGVNP